jgi:uncharacterized protein with ParB-like and HNH nuclease domain
MAGGYEKAITIEAAIRNIVERRYLLPSIQRNFIWKMDQICRLFDSVMQRYPINSLMLWRVDSAGVREGFRFYSFLEKYVEDSPRTTPTSTPKGTGCSTR